MNDEKDVQKLHDAISKAVFRFKGTKVTESTFCEMEHVIMTVLNEFYCNGYIEVVPIVDINHRSEMLHIRKQIHELTKTIDEAVTTEESIRLCNERTMLAWHLDSLKRDVDNLNDAQIFFKNKDYTPFGFEIYGSRYG